MAMKFMLILTLFLSVDQSEMLQTREMFVKAYDNEENNVAFLEHLEKKKNIKPVEMGYMGVGKMMMARYYWNPYSKWKSFVNGRDMLDEAVAKDLKNIELRFLRLSVQMNVPSFLFYNEEIEGDTEYIRNNYYKLADDDLKKRIKKFWTEEDLGEFKG